MTERPMYLLVGEDGEPLGTLNLEMIEDEGCKFAFALAAASGDPAELDRVQAETLARVGVESFPYVACNALRVVVEHILGPSFDVTAALGHDLRAGIKAIAEGRSPSGGGS